MFNKRFLFSALALSLAVFAGCDSNPTNKLLNPAVVVHTSAWANPFIIYENELKAGNVQFFTTQEGQILDFNSTESVANGSTKSLKYSWDGTAVTPYSSRVPTTGWSGFGLAVQNPNVPNSPVTKDITPGHYTQVSFKIRGGLSSNVAFRLQVQAAGNVIIASWQSNTTYNKITDSWQTCSFTISGPQNKVAYYLTFTFINLTSERCNGGTVYLDEIQITK